MENQGDNIKNYDKDTETLISKIVKKAEKYGNAEAALASNSTSSVFFENNNLSNVSSGIVSELHVRISNGKKFGFAKTTNISKWEKCIQNAYNVMKNSNALEQGIVLQEKNRILPVKGIFSKKMSMLKNEDILKSTKEMLDSAKSIDKRINVSLAEQSVSTVQANIGNSNNINLSEKENIFSSSIDTNIGEISGSEGKLFHDIFDVTKVGKAAAELCLSGLNPKPVKTMKADLILNYFAAADILSTILVPAFCADNVQTGKSFLRGKLGQKVFSENISISDNAVLENGLFSGSFDLEGTGCQNTKLVESGALKNYLYDNYSAIKDNAKSTGNCAGLQKVPFVKPSNFIISPGKYSKEHIISETKKGILANFAFGTHVANILTGDASIGVSNALYIENGEIIHPVKQAMVSFNLFEALKNIELVGNKLRQESNIAAPIICLKNVQIIGN